jgi:hypothetical protein
MNIFLQSAISRLRYYKELADKTFLQLEDTDFHFQPSSQSNSLAVIIRHMSGNMLSRWTNFLTEDGEKPWRQRDEEFNTASRPKKNSWKYGPKAGTACSAHLKLSPKKTF